jgi:hypothetical protein
MTNDQARMTNEMRVGVIQTLGFGIWCLGFLFLPNLKPRTPLPLPNLTSTSLADKLHLPIIQR